MTEKPKQAKSATGDLLIIISDGKRMRKNGWFEISREAVINLVERRMKKADVAEMSIAIAICHNDNKKVEYLMEAVELGDNSELSKKIKNARDTLKEPVIKHKDSQRFISMLNSAPEIVTESRLDSPVRIVMLISTEWAYGGDAEGLNSILDKFLIETDGLDIVYFAENDTSTNPLFDELTEHVVNNSLNASTTKIYSNKEIDKEQIKTIEEKLWQCITR